MSMYIIVPSWEATNEILNLTEERHLSRARKSDDGSKVVLEIKAGKEDLLLNHFQYTSDEIKSLLITEAWDGNL